MLTISSTYEEQERILATFKSGKAMCNAALLTALYALITLLLSVVHTFSFIINFSIGMLTCLYGVVCMIRLLLIQVQYLLSNPLSTVERRCL